MSDKNHDQHGEDSYDKRLKGTFVSVLIIGLFIILSWFGIFTFYWTTL